MWKGKEGLECLSAVDLDKNLFTAAKDSIGGREGGPQSS